MPVRCPARRLAFQHACVASPQRRVRARMAVPCTWTTIGARCHTARALAVYTSGARRLEQLARSSHVAAPVPSKDRFYRVGTEPALAVRQSLAVTTRGMGGWGAAPVQAFVDQVSQRQ